MDVSSISDCSGAASATDRAINVQKKAQDVTKDQFSALIDMMKKAPMPEGVGTQINEVA